MRYIYVCLMFFIILALSSCLDDKTELGNTDDILLPDSVIVTNIKTNKRLLYDTQVTRGVYSLEPGEELQLDVEVIYQGDDEIVCEWYFEGEVIGTGINLRHIFEKDGAGALAVYRKNAGNATIYPMQIKMIRPYDSGIFVLGKDKGEVKLDFVRSSYASTKVEFDNVSSNITLYSFTERGEVYAAMNGSALHMEYPRKLFNYRGFNWDTGILWGLQILDERWQNSVTVDLDNIKKLTSMNDEFIASPQGLEAVDFVNIGPMNLVLDKSGKIYSRVNYDYGNPCTGKYSAMPLAYDDPYDVPDKGALVINAHRLFPHNLDPMTLIYEKERKRFLVMAAINDSFLSFLDYCYLADFSKPANIDNLPAGYVDLNSVDKELITVVSTMQRYGEYYFFFKDNLNYYLQKCILGVSTWDIPFQSTYTAESIVTLSPEIGQLLAAGGNCFAISEEDDFIYFTSGNALYSIDISGKNLTKIFEFPQKDRITHLRIMRPWTKDSQSATLRYHNGRVFSVAFENGDFKVVKLYDDPSKPNELQYLFWVDQHYDGGVYDILYTPYLAR